MAAATLVEKVPGNGAEEQQPPLGPEELAAQKREQRLRKFRELHLKRNEARKLNHQEVVEEDKRLKLPANWEAKKLVWSGNYKKKKRKRNVQQEGKTMRK